MMVINEKKKYLVKISKHDEGLASFCVTHFIFMVQTK